MAEELNKPVIKKFKKRKVYSSFRDNIWGVDLADMQHWVNLTMDISIYYVPLTYLVNMYGVFL